MTKKPVTTGRKFNWNLDFARSLRLFYISPYNILYKFADIGFLQLDLVTKLSSM